MIRWWGYRKWLKHIIFMHLILPHVTLLHHTPPYHHRSGGSQLLTVIVQHCVWGAGAVDSCSARLALQVCTHTDTCMHTHRYIHTHTCRQKHTHSLTQHHNNQQHRQSQWAINSNVFHHCITPTTPLVPPDDGLVPSQEPTHRQWRIRHDSERWSVPQVISPLHSYMLLLLHSDTVTLPYLCTVTLDLSYTIAHIRPCVQKHCHTRTFLQSDSNILSCLYTHTHTLPSPGLLTDCWRCCYSLQVQSMASLGIEWTAAGMLWSHSSP